METIKKYGAIAVIYLAILFSGNLAGKHDSLNVHPWWGLPVEIFLEFIGIGLMIWIIPKKISNQTLN